MFRVYLMLCAAPWLAQAAITLTGKRCGTKMCSLAEYCSSFHNQCEHCATVCTRTEHNFDQAICESQCQDYLHDIRFAKASDYAAEIRTLERQQMIIIILLAALLLLFVAVHGFLGFRWLRKKGHLSIKSLKSKEKPPPEITVANPHTQSPKVNSRKIVHPKANSAYTVSVLEGSTMRTASTPISNRYPGEDSTLDYNAYDNAALQMTPGEKPRSETVF